MTVFVPFSCPGCGKETFGKNEFVEDPDGIANRKVIKVCEDCGTTLMDPDMIEEG